MKKGSWSLISTFLVILKIASAVKFWQITDLHYDEFYHEKGDTNQFCHFKNGSAGRYGDYQCEGRLYNTVWKLQKFSITQILREIILIFIFQELLTYFILPSRL